MKQTRDLFASKLKKTKFTSVNREGTMTALTGNTTIEIVNASFIANEPALFGTVDEAYVKREEAWYNSMSLNVNDIPGGAPAVWRAVADQDGYINSNYGWCIYSPENVLDTDNWGLIANGVETPIGRTLCQYNLVLEELQQSPSSRRAIMIYTRPSMWLDYNKGTTQKRSDFMCTNAVQYMIRDGALHAIVQMRSNDAILGFKNDRAWQQHVLCKLAEELDVEVGNLYWNVGSLHVYARHYFLVDHYLRSGGTAITKAVYQELYPDSPYITI
jgi:thymidylate synthase